MSSNPIRLQYLLRKYLQNNLLPDEQTEFWRLLGELSENDLVSEELQQLWDQQAAFAALQPEQINSAYQELQFKIRAQQPVAVQPQKRLRPLHWMAAAAILALVAIAWWYTSTTQSITTPAQQGPLATAVHPSLQTLPDGSIVSLNANSKIDSIRFSDNLRELYFQGEGFFNIQHDASRPFLVHTQGIVTRVLGTQFNIKAYPGQKRVMVTVTNGKVQVEKSGSTEPLGVLTPGEQLVVEENIPLPPVTKANIAEVVEWKNAALLFDNQSLPDAVQVLKKQFGVAITLQDTALFEQHFTADFSDKKLSEIMDIICVLTGAAWRKQADTIIIEETKKLP